MANVLHGSARTTPRIRAELQASKESSRALAARYGLNPIEQFFSKLKTLLRKADERSVEATWRRIGTLLDCFKPD